MAKKQAAESAQVEARVLVASVWGKPDAVVSLSKEEADAGVAAGELDTHPDAVAYAKAAQSQATA